MGFRMDSIKPGLLEVLDLLPIRLRRTCVLCWFERMTWRQAAAVQGVSPEAIHKRLQRARRLLHAAGVVPPARRRTGTVRRTASLSCFENI